VRRKCSFHLRAIIARLKCLRRRPKYVPQHCGTTTQVIICKICLELLDLTLGICNVQGRQIQLIINDGIFAVY
jgi:hypothetical protein